MEQLGWHPNEISKVKNKGMPHMGTCILHTPPPCAYQTRRRQQRELELSRKLQETDDTEVYVVHSLQHCFRVESQPRPHNTWNILLCLH